MVKNPKGKGNANERKAAKLLSVWYYDDPNVLVRSDGIGPTATIRGDSLALNDILQVKRFTEPFPFCVELKHYKDPVLLTDLFRPLGDFWKAWVQCTTAALLTKREPLLVYRTNNRTPLVACSWNEDSFLTETLVTQGLELQVIGAKFQRILICQDRDFFTAAHATRIKARLAEKE